jgi:GNAT superfamily N-acetyltransferase
METADPTIRLLTTHDLDAAFGISAAAGWNQRVADWRMLLQLAPAGSFAAVAESGIIGTAIGIDYGTFGWIAMMLVDPAWRGRGIGARLLEAAMGAVPPEIPIRLDATPLGRPLYQRYGFEDEAMLTRHVARPLDLARGGPSNSLPAPEPDVEAHHVRRLTEADLPAVNALDDRVFGGHRRIVLKWALDGAPHYAQAIDTGACVDYCFGRPGRLFDQIGPVVAAGNDTARALVSASLLAAEGKAVVVDAFDRHDGFSGWLRSRGFAASRPLFRMRRAAHDGGRVAHAEPHSGFAERAILGPEFG